MAWLREHLAPEVFAGEDLLQVFVVVLVGPVGENGWQAHADADRIDAERSETTPGVSYCLLDGALHRR